MLKLPSNNKSLITASCIIEEQPEHLVIALRVPKQAIEDNVHLLAYLASVSVDPPAKPQKLPLARWIGNRVVGLAAVLAIAVGGLLIDWSPHAVAQDAPSLEFVSDLAVSEPYDTVNDILHVEVWAKRNSLCETSTERIVRLQPSNAAIWSDKKFGSPLAVEPHHKLLKVAVKLPNIDPGEYTYVAHIHTNCGGPVEHTTVGPVTFTVPQH